MRKITFILLLFAQLSASAQTTQAPPATLEYRLDYIRPDSFYLVEVKTIQGKPGERGKVEEESILLRDTSQLRVVIEQAEKQESELLRKADEYRNLQESAEKMYATIRQRINLAPDR